MEAERPEQKKKKSGKVLSRTGMVVGAAGLLMFIVGIKRSYRLDDEHEVRESDAPRRRTPRKD